MLRIRLLTVLMALTAAPIHAQTSEYELPADPLAPVITLNFVGGLTAMPRQNIRPQLSIRADGQVTVNDPFSRTKDVEGVISSSELHDLMRFVVYEQGFFQFNSQDTQAEIFAESARCGKSMGVVAPDTTVIHVKTADNEQETRFNALGTFAVAYPTVTSLGQLWAIETRLRYLMEQVRAGGIDAVTAGLEQANAYMKRQPTSLKLEAGDLRRSNSFPDGRKVLEFVRDCGDGTSVSVSVEYTARALPTVNYRIDLNPPVQPVMSCS